MSLTITEATDEILTLFHDTWSTDPDTSSYPVHYEGRPFDVPENQVTEGHPLSWARVLIRFPNSDKSTVGNTAGRSRFTRNGFISVHLFTPLGVGGSLKDTLTQKVMDIFEGQRTAGGVIFRSTSAPTSGEDGVWFHNTVTVFFEYDQIK